MEKILQSILQEVKHLNQRVDKVEDNLSQRIDKVEDNLSQRMDKVENSLNQRIDKIEEDLQKVSEVQQYIKRGVVETDEGLLKLEKVQVDQQQIIELLSARSIQQEAELKSMAN